MAKAAAKSTTKVRKSSKKQGLCHTDQLELIHLYAKGQTSTADIAKQFGTSEENVGLIVNRHWKELTNMKESRALISPSKDSNSTLRLIHNTSHINQAFLDLLSPPSLETLTEAESIYCWLLIHTGDLSMAFQESGLDAGLIKGDRNSRHSYDKALLVRQMYLANKPNVASYLKDLRERKYIDTDITKSRLQLELLEQLDLLKRDPIKHKKEILTTLKLLGSSAGVWVDRMEVGTIDHNKALDQFFNALEKRQEIPESQDAEFTVIEAIDTQGD